MAGKLISPYGGVVRDSRSGCGSVSPFVTVPGYGSSKGYRYDVPRAGGAGRKQRKKFSLKEFLRETAAGGITGGVASAGFYGAGKGIKALRNNLIGDITLVNNEYRVNGGKMIVFKPKI